MPTMTKRVNVRATVAVRNTNPPIYGTYKNIIMTTGDILKCLTKRATVDEILPDGSTIRLNYKNYYTDNGAGLDAKGETKIIKPKKPPIKKAAPKEPEKPAVDITFNEAPIANTAETVEETSEVVEKAAIEGSLDVLKNEDGEEVDVPTGDLKDEPAEIETEAAVETEPSILATDGNLDEETTITTEDAERSDTQVLDEEIDIVKNDDEAVSSNEKISEDPLTGVSTAKTDSVKDKPEVKTDAAPKTATTAKKKSTSTKKKK